MPSACHPHRPPRVTPAHIAPIPGRIGDGALSRLKHSSKEVQGSQPGRVQARAAAHGSQLRLGLRFFLCFFPCFAVLDAFALSVTLAGSPMTPSGITG